MAITQIDPALSDPLMPAWAGKPWHVSAVDSNNFGVQAPDTVTFTGTTVQILNQSQTQSSTTSQSAPWPWGTLDPGSVAFALLSPGSNVTGQTSWGQPFHLECPYQGNEHKLACFMDESSPQFPWNAVALGTIAGTLLGALAGFIARSPVVGMLAGLLGSTIGSLVVARDGYNESLTGPNPTWVATDGIAGKPGTQGSGPHHPLRKVSA